MTRPQGSVDLGIRGLDARVGDHIAYFWETPEDFEEGVCFLERGIRQGDHAVVFGHEAANARVLDLLDTMVEDVDRLRSEGRLSVLGPESTSDRMLKRIGDTFEEALDGGAPLIRLLGNIGWGKDEWPGETDILRFEAKVTAAAAEFPSVAVCMYDVAALDQPDVLQGAFHTHPLTIYRNVVRENPACRDLETFLEDLAARGEPTGAT